MKVAVAMDSFKGSMSSLVAGEAVKQGIKAIYPDAEVMVCPVADGGEGTVQSLTLGMGGTFRYVRVTGPLGKKVEACYGILEESKTAIIEMAAAAGITLLNIEERNPLVTTTYGVGELIRDAISNGCRHFIVGIGGSATNDGGIGMLQALGYEFLDRNGNQVSFGAKGLGDIVEIKDEHVIEELKVCDFKVACDVSNPLCGDEGCSAIFGPQKGATKEMIEQMEQWLLRFGRLTKKKYKKADYNAPGSGAAGGLGFAFLSYTNAILQSGIQIVLEETKLEQYMKEADLVITGEGKLDGQTVMGKAPAGVSKLAKKYNKKVIAFSGCVAEDAEVCNDYGIDAYFPILQELIPLEEAMKQEVAKKNLTKTVKQIMRLLK